ncbi:MAG: sulfatase-like hydrolase/transferase, partial [Acidobacteria bacterium]|nr:sulfatase-like hydrolase/transferase [Acidobacteriota bacterium]
MERRQFLAGCNAALLGPAAARDDRPNVLFLMTDELHQRALSLTGNPYIRTPHMDRIGREGVRFTNATCVTPFCSPSRASMITGLYPHRHGIVQNVGARGDRQAPLAPDAFPNTEMTLHGRGYATAFRGKWHLGDPGDFPCYESFSYASKTSGGYAAFLEERLPAARFEQDRDPGRYLGRPVEKIPAIRKAWQPFQKAAPGLGYIATIGRTVIPPELLPETQITNQVVELIERNRDRNFMITASWSPPHDLWVTPEPYYSLVDRGKIKLPGTSELEPWDRRGPSKLLGDLAGEEGLREYAAIYHGMVKYMDDQVGRVLTKLDELKLSGNTLVVLTSDHGDMAGAHGCIGKSIFSFFDDLVRIPLCVRFPGRIKAGTVVRNPVSQVDFMPTILDYLGLRIPEKIHGRSLRPLIEGRPTAWRDYAFCQRG